MSSELLSIQQKKDAIGRGLSQYMNDAALKKALAYWEQEYSRQPSFVLNRFLTEVCHSDELRFFKKDILKKILSELSSVEKLAITQSSNSANSIAAKQTADAFQYFIKTACRQVEVQHFDEFNDDVIQVLIDGEIEILLNSKIDEVLFLDFISAEYYADVITAIYQVFCEYYGPSKADFVYARIKEQIKYEFPHVDIRNLL